MHLCISIAGHSNNPWYMQDEIAELKFLRRHKSVMSDVERFSFYKWLNNDPFKSCESEQDAYLLLSRYSIEPGQSRTCSSCNKMPKICYKCLECIDVGLCEICNDRGEEPKGHVAHHKMVELR